MTDIAARHRRLSPTCPATESFLTPGPVTSAGGGDRGAPSLIAGRDEGTAARREQRNSAKQGDY